MVAHPEQELAERQSPLMPSSVRMRIAVPRDQQVGVNREAKAKSNMSLSLMSPLLSAVLPTQSSSLLLSLFFTSVAVTYTYYFVFAQHPYLVYPSCRCCDRTTPS